MLAPQILWYNWSSQKQSFAEKLKLRKQSKDCAEEHGKNNNWGFEITKAMLVLSLKEILTLTGGGSSECHSHMD